MTEQEEPKIIVDEDWKSQVEKEKEELRQKEEAPSSPSGDIPEASFQVLLTTLATQAIAMMGLLPNMGGEEPAVNLPMARHLVDMIAVLEEKTKGNLTDDEAAAIKGNLHQLRMAFVEASRIQTTSGADGEKTPDSPTIELP